MHKRLATIALFLFACNEPTERGNTPDAPTDERDEALSQLEMSWAPFEPDSPLAVVQMVTPTLDSPLALIQGGTTTLGCTDGQIDCTDWEVVYNVTLTNDFWLGTTEVTEALWTEVTGAPMRGCPDCPVSGKSWYAAVAFLNTLSLLEGLEQCYECEPFDDIHHAFCYEIMDPYTCEGYRLPTEAEWEYGARCGQDLTYSGSTDFDDVAWVKENSGKLMRVAQLDPNPCGLYDMSGNMFEWNHDWYVEARESSYKDPYGPPAGTDRLSRGGAYDYLGLMARVSFRNRCRRPEMDFPNQGFRLARTAH